MTSSNSGGSTKKQPVGTLWPLEADPATVTRPDGTDVTVSGGAYVLDQLGDHTAGDQTVKAV